VETRLTEDLTRPEAPEAGVTVPIRPGGRSPLVAAALSFAFPGAGQLYLGRRVAAVAFAIPALAALAWAALQLSRGFVYFTLSMLDSEYALTVMIVAALVTAWRIAAIVHPFLVVRPLRLGSRAGAGLAILIVATLAMGNFVLANAYAAYSAVGQMASNDFIDGAPSTDEPTDAPDLTFAPENTGWPLWSAPPDASPGADPCATPTPGIAGMPASNHIALAAVQPALVFAADASPIPSSATPSPTPSSSHAPAVTPSPSPSPTPTPAVSPSASPTDSTPHRLTVLLAGVDFLAGRHHALTDSLMLVSIDLRTRDVSMVSVPRDTAAFPFYWGGEAPVNFKINSLANAIAAGRFGSPDSPMVTLANEIGYLVGVKVDYYAEIDMAGFSELIDLVGGVDINNPSLLNDPFTCTYVPAGPVHLNGWLALKYARSRESSSDYARASRQQIVLMALEKKLASPATLPKLGSVLGLAGKSIATNFPLKTARDYVDVAQHINKISRCVLGPPYNFHPDSSLTRGSWTSRLKLDQVANLSVALFGTDSRYYGQPGVAPAACKNRA
jgi:LCP family protein required for cell wall assembly